MAKASSKLKTDKSECKVVVIRHLMVEDQETTINALCEDDWELIAVDNGIAYFSRYITS